MTPNQFTGPNAGGARQFPIRTPLTARVDDVLSRADARLAPMLAPSGRLLGDLSVTCLAEDEYWLVGSYYLQEWHLRWLREQGHEVAIARHLRFAVRLDPTDPGVAIVSRPLYGS